MIVAAMWCRKSGTSYIQMTLASHNHSLWDKGIFYPFNKTSADIYAHAVLVGREPAAEELIISHKSCCDVIFSSEYFDNFNMSTVERFRDTYAPHFDIKVVYFYRNAFEHIFSAWQQKLRATMEKRLILYEKFLHPNSGRDCINRVTKYIEIFGSKNVHILDYDYNIRKHKDILNEMLKTVSLPALDLPYVPKGVSLRTSDNIARQIWLLFDDYVKSYHKCSFFRTHPVRLYNFDFSHTELGQLTLPQKCKAFSWFRDKAVLIDLEFRRIFSANIIAGDAELTKKEIYEVPDFCELDMPAVLRNRSFFVVAYEKQLSNLPSPIKCLPLDK